MTSGLNSDQLATTWLGDLVWVSASFSLYLKWEHLHLFFFVLDWSEEQKPTLHSLAQDTGWGQWTSSCMSPVSVLSWVDDGFELGDPYHPPSFPTSKLLCLIPINPLLWVYPPATAVVLRTFPLKIPQNRGPQAPLFWKLCVCEMLHSPQAFVIKILYSLCPSLSVERCLLFTCYWSAIGYSYSLIFSFVWTWSHPHCLPGPPSLFIKQQWYINKLLAPRGTKGL